MITLIPSLRNFGLFFMASSLLVVSLTSGSAMAQQSGSLEQAIELYNAGNYSEARPILERLVGAGNDDGIVLYRLYFCQRSAGDAAQRATLEKARAALERDVATATTFEAGFYLANAYANLSMEAQLPIAAARTTARFEAGEIPKPVQPLEQFRLGKLYADQQRDRLAQPWYESAVVQFVAQDGGGQKAYLEWAARWLAKRAMEQQRFEEAVTQFGHLSRFGGPSVTDLDQYGLAALVIGRYDESGDAWRRAARLDVANADRYRYGSALAMLASKTPELPTSPDGERSWEELAKEELEAILTDQAKLARDARAEADASAPLSIELRKEFLERMEPLRPRFVAAAQEYLTRGYNLREAAFFGGYAPLVFHLREWRPAPNPRKQRRTPQEIQEAREKFARQKAELEAKDGKNEKEKKPN
jgi:tetratricopeptide (TPR) repeat protein